MYGVTERHVRVLSVQKGVRVHLDSINDVIISFIKTTKIIQLLRILRLLRV